MKQNKYSKLPSKPSDKVASAGSPLILRYKQPDGRFKNIKLTFFVAGKFPRPQIAKACAEVLALEMQRYSKDTILNFTFSLSVFNKFLDWRAEGGRRLRVLTTHQFSRELFVEFLAYLEIFFKEGTAASRYQAAARFFDLMRALRPAYLPSELRMPANSFSHRQGQSSTAADVLSLGDLKRIERAASEGVKQIRENHRAATEMLRAAAVNDAEMRRESKKGVRRAFWQSAAKALYYMVRVEGIASTSMATRKMLNKNRQPRAGEIIGWYAPTSEEYFIPFLVLLYIRTAINVTSIYRLKRDCLTEHPLPLGVTKISFTKPRAKPLSNKELTFPTDQAGGVVDLVNFLLEYTQPWVEYASEAERRSLFLCHRRTKGVRATSHNLALLSPKRFIARHKLPHFTFDQLRPTVATLIYLKTRDIFRVQRLLGHASVRTTVKYVRGAAAHAESYRAIAGGIDDMTEAITGVRHGGGVSTFTEPAADVLAQKVKAEELSADAGDMILRGGCNTLVGKCKDPWNSPQPGEVKGRVCRSLHACIFCENCWIFSEDLVEVIKYRASLEAEKSNMTAGAWELLHGPAVREINGAILTSFPPEMVIKAESQAKQAK